MNRRIKTILAVGLVAFLLATQSQVIRVTNADAGKAAGPQEMAETARMKPIAVSGRLLVKYRAGVSPSRRNTLMMVASARADREIPGLGVHVVELAYGADDETSVQALRAQPEVEFVEPDYLCYPVSTMEPDDPMYASQWHLPAISCPTAWGMTSGSDQITIALCDTGVEATHPDLASKLVPGWNVVDNNSDTSPVASHGTWTAGTAAATGNNSIGVASPALNCRIMPVRVSSLLSGAAMQSDLAAGVVWAADHGARVASVSYMGAANSTMMDAGRYIQSRGGVLVMAAGNTGTYNSAPDTPDIIVVSATAGGDVLAGFTTTGAYVDLSAPGTSILTTAPGNSYQAVSGTSFSTPLVAGAIGLMLSVKPDLTPAQIDTILKVTADDFGPAGWDPGYGWGRLNVGRAINVVEGMVAGAPDTTPPAVGFLNPTIGGDTNGLIGISGSELVQVNALDDRAPIDVSLFADGAPLGTSGSAPYTFYCDTSLFADGSQHTLTAVARDQAGNTTSISTLVTARAGFDATPPTVGFVQPQANGQIAISSAETVQLSASDNQGVTALSLIADGALVGTVTSLPYTFTLNTSSFARGSLHTLSAVAGDQAGNSTTVSTTVTAGASRDTTPPLVGFQQPQAGGTVGISQGEQVTVSASDNVGVASVSLYADGALVGSDTAAPYSFSWNTSSLSAGSQHTLRAVAGDQAGNSSSVSITVTVGASVDTTAPQVWFINPVNADRVSGNQTITMGASDNVAVTRVELYIDNQLFTTLTRAPYTVKWKANTAAKGNHTLTAIAYDAAGNNASTSITVNK
ncbi:MAG TPA: Ig-like domain-containing protein [Blastocatellia bacterium]|nr:Ig-like domain-containing protein [Blastocatellia bacterium]